MRRPLGIVREKSVDETHLIDDEKTEGEAQKSGDQAQSMIETSEAAFGNRKWDRNCRGDQHHAGDGANSKNQKI